MVSIKTCNTTFAPNMMSSPSLGQKCKNTIQTLTALTGDYVPVYDSLKGGVISASPSRGRKIAYSFEDNSFRVIFQSRPNAVFFLEETKDGRVKLASPSNPSYGFYLVSNFNGLLHWQNVNDSNHIVHWQNTLILPTYSSPDVLVLPTLPTFSEQGSDPSLTLNSGVLSLSPMLKSIGLEESPSSDALYSQGPLLPSLHSMHSVDSLIQPSLLNMHSVDSLLQIPQGFPTMEKTSSLQMQSEKTEIPLKKRAHSISLPVVKDSKKSRSQTYERDSKQNLVNLVEPKVDEMLSRYYASEDQYQKNQNGRMGPPVLRGEDVLFIPAKKKAALQNVVSLLEELRDFGCTITAATKVCQKKKKRQLKGFLIYIQLASKEEVQAFLDGPYRAFEDTMQGVKKAIF